MPGNGQCSRERAVVTIAGDVVGCGQHTTVLNIIVFLCGHVLAAAAAEPPLGAPHLSVVHILVGARPCEAAAATLDRRRGRRRAPGQGARRAIGAAGRAARQSFP